MRMAKIPIKVNCYSGFKGEERPVSFIIGEKTFQVVELLDTWYGEGHDYYKVSADDRAVYIIRYDREMDEWELTMMESGKEG